MHDLRKIVKSVTSVKQIKQEELDKILKGHRNSKLARLAREMQHPGNVTDKAAGKNIYGSESTGKYRMLKSRLKDRMLNLIFLSDNDVSFKNKYYKTVFRLNRNILAAKFLVLKDARDVAVPLLKASLSAAMQHGLTRESVECVRELCYHFAYANNRTAFVRHQQLDIQLQRVSALEREMEQLYHSTLWAAGHTAGYNSNGREVIKNNFSKAQALLKKNNSYLIRLNYHRIAYYYYHSRNRFDTVIKTCNRFIDYLDRHPLLYQGARYAEFGLYILEACMRVQDYKNAKKFARHCAHHYIKFSSPWLQLHEYIFLLAMRSGNVTDALSIHQSITASHIYYKLPENQKERWRIYKAFLNFALTDEVTKIQFNLYRFLNEVPVSNRDKQGYNFSVLIAKIILLINFNDFGRLHDIEKELKKYIGRYNLKNLYARHYYFGNMLLLLMQHNYSMAPIRKKIDFYFTKLKHTANIHQPLEHTEVIRYEILWKIILSRIGKLSRMHPDWKTRKLKLKNRK
jgi:hypothetical protein